MGVKLLVAFGVSVFRSYSFKSGGQLKKSSQGGYKHGRTGKGKVASGKPRIQWTDEQKQLLGHIRNGLSVFITGSAGTGKTFLLEEIIRILRRVHQKNRVFVTASTGVAACALNGQTLHSFVGLGLVDCSEDRDALLDKVLMCKRACRVWKKVQALVIDEISMVEANMFENLEYVARRVRESSEPWGGIQLVVSGDFFQLPPVIKKLESSSKVFAFEADCWDVSFDKQYELTNVFRQSDPELIRLLQTVRKGESNGEELKLLQKRCCVNEPNDSLVRLYPRNKNVIELNDERLRNLNEEILSYQASDGGCAQFRMQLKQGVAPDCLKVCKGARVMLIRNLNVFEKLCNGAVGTVVGFTQTEDESINKRLSASNFLPIVKFDSGKKIVIQPQKWEIKDGDVAVAWRHQIPLILAWALSIHKCQGMTVDRLYTDLSGCFSYGMVYVVLSRVRSLEGLYLDGFCPSKIQAHPKVVKFYERLADEQLQGK